MKPIWEKVGRFFQYHIPGYVVFGTVEKERIFGNIKQGNDYYIWSARIMLDCRIDYNPISGKALSLEKAKHIVEVLCLETDTLFRNNIIEGE